MSLSDLIPSKYAVYAYLAAAIVALGGVSFIYYKIDHAGYERCQADYTAQAAADQAAAQKIILTIGKKYDETKAKIYHQSGPNDLVGPRTALSIDRLPDHQRVPK